MRTYYDPPTALTFLLAGMGLGTLIALILAPRARIHHNLSEIRSEERQPESRPLRAV